MISGYKPARFFPTIKSGCGHNEISLRANVRYEYSFLICLSCRAAWDVPMTWFQPEKGLVRVR